MSKTAYKAFQLYVAFWAMRNPLRFFNSPAEAIRVESTAGTSGARPAIRLPAKVAT